LLSQQDRGHINREIAARPDFVQIENGWRSAKEQRPGAIQLGHLREIETVVENPDAEPALPCAAAKTAIIVYGKRVGTTLTVCTDRNCPVHDPKAAAEHAANSAPVMAPAPEEETEDEAAEREREYAQRRKEYEEEQQRKDEERRQQFQREHEAHEAERARLAEMHKARLAMLDRIVANAPVMFSAAQLRTLLSALITLDPYAFEDVAGHYIGDDENNQQTAEEILASVLASLSDDNLTGFSLRLVLTAHTAIPHESELDFLAEAEAAFVPPQPKKSAKAKKANTEKNATRKPPVKSQPKTAKKSALA
jgi:ParB family transcriptional regulator, chromosome partitioning protein